MLDLSMPVLIWLLLIGALGVSFVKNSVQAAGLLFLICLITSRFELFLAISFLLFVSLLIPKPNPRHQKRRFQISKAFYVLLTGYAGWILDPYILKSSFQAITEPSLDFSLSMIAPLSFFVFVIFLLFMRRHAT